MTRRPEDDGGTGFGRRDFVRIAGIGTAGLLGRTAAARTQPDPRSAAESAATLGDSAWPSLRYYPPERLGRIALPLGGIGSGTV